MTDNNRLYCDQYEKQGQLILQGVPELSSLLEEFSGAIFDNGLFKVHNIGSLYFWTELTFEYFKKFKGRSYCFACDWLGRQYAVNYYDNGVKILMLDPATAEAFELEKDIQAFLNEDLVEFKIDMLEVDRFEFFFNNKFDYLEFDQCFGFKKLLFLGGRDESENFELIDMEVYWELNYQIYSKIKNLPGGTLISGLSIE